MVEMLTIQNIGKIIGKSIPMSEPLRLAKIEDVYGTIDAYAFRVKIETPKDTKKYSLRLDRKKIPYPAVISDCWELSYDTRPNQRLIEALGKEDLNDMVEVQRRIGNLMDRILNQI
jgi:hypothetical protein